MTPFPPELEALMPPPFDLLYEFSSPFGGVVRRTSSNQYNGSAPTKSVPVFTADQVRQAMLDATERAAKVSGAVVSAYSLPGLDGSKIDEIRVERARQMNGGALWAVRYRGDVLNKQGEWEWEPMPSGRDEAFLARARFNSAEEAIAAAIRGGGQGS